MSLIIDSAKFPAIWSGAERQTFEEFFLNHLPVSLMDYIPPAERAGLRAYTSTYNCDAAWDAAYAALPALGGTLFVPAARYNFATTKHIHKRIKFLGEGGSINAAALASRFIFSANTTGIVVHRSDTDENGIDLTPTTSAAGTIFQGLHIQGSGSADVGKHGIVMRAPAIIRDCNIQSFAGNNIHIDADLSETGTLYGNADGWQLKVVSSLFARGHGIYVHGANSRGAAFFCDFSQNHGFGVRDETEWGTPFIGCHCATNSLGHYYVEDGNASHSLINCYTEGGQGSGARLGEGSICAGGLIGIAFSSGITGGQVGPNVSDRNCVLDNGKVHGGFQFGFGSTPNRQSVSVGRSGNGFFSFAYEGEATAVSGNSWQWSNQPKMWVRTGSDTTVEMVGSDLGGTALSNNRKKDEAGVVLAAATITFPRSQWFASLSDAGEHRQFRYLSGNLPISSFLAAGDITLTAANLFSVGVVVDCGGANRNVTLPTAALLVAAIQNVAAVGQIIEFPISNGSDAAETITIVAGSGGTWDANQTATSRVVPQNSARDVRIRLTNVSVGTEAYTVAT